MNRGETYGIQRSTTDCKENYRICKDNNKAGNEFVRIKGVM